jgi:hypothetical protein
VRFCFARAFSFHWRTGLSVVRAGGSLEQIDLYKGTRFLTFEGSPDGLRVQNFRMPVLGYDVGLNPPADFQVFHLPALPSYDAARSRPGSSES